MKMVKKFDAQKLELKKSENVKEFFQDNIFLGKVVKFLRNEKSINYISSPSRHRLYPLEKESF